MKIIKKLNIKKIYKSLKTGVLSTNTFFLLLGVFFSTLALAVTLTVTPIFNRILMVQLLVNVLVLNYQMRHRVMRKVNL